MTFHFAFYYNKLLKESLISFCGICFSKLTSLNLSLTIWTLCVCICVCACVCVCVCVRERDGAGRGVNLPN